ncbi:sigma-70 family RNA polymerase sigma factor [Flagellimonas lutimaris]|jgi:RNA polymerase sigma factor (sigma-70 family)|uniref:sigma-70 family RNA polymerase sigma factor n=1 Tax=Flagellimonas TaxID=444459 RepID=UPI000B6DAEE9|nr:MAG: sigma-70 family RNA polymerase sigma factor [Muricauda sp. TMED12]|tara:strand:+ start:1215 stop:1991 length:777 start_codon:yes stop_codon:yes gene_type:complete
MEKIKIDSGQELPFQERVAEAFSELRQLKQQGDTHAFGNHLIAILPEVRSYMTKRFNTALGKGMLPKGKYKIDDFIDQLFLEAFEHFDEVTNKWDLNPWLFKKADMLLDEVIEEEEFDEVFFENIDTYSQLEWKSMEEKFSTDGDGDYVMLEELDDISYHGRDYLLKNIFLDEDKKDLMAKLDRQQERDTIAKHIDLVLYHMSEQMQSIYQLYAEQRFGVREIARIKNIAVEEVQQLLNKAKEHLESSLYYRFLTDNV